MKTDRRAARRKPLKGLTISHLTAFDKFALLARTGLMIDASSSGILLRINRKDLVPKSLRSNLSLTALEGEHVMLRISEMDLEMEGFVTRTKLIGKGDFEVAIDFSQDAPDYWRECFMDLLPDAGDFEEH